MDKQLPSSNPSGGDVVAKQPIGGDGSGGESRPQLVAAEARFPQPTDVSAGQVKATTVGETQAQGTSQAGKEEKIISLLASILAQEEELAIILEMLAELLQASRLRLWRFSEDKTRLDLVKEWEKRDEDDLSENWKTLDSSTFPYVLEQVAANQIVVVDSLEQLSEKAESDKDMLSRQKISSCMFIPFYIKNDLGGVIQADNLVGAKSWTNLRLLERLSLIGRGVGTLVHKPEEVEEEAGTSMVALPPEPVAQQPNELGAEYKAIFNSVDVGIVVLTTEGLIKQVNAQAAAMFGLDIVAMQGKKMDDIVGIFSAESVEVLHRNMGMLKMGTPLPPFQVKIETSSGEIRVLELKATILKQDDQPIGELLLVHDATIKNQIEQAVEQSEKQLRTVLESVRQGIMFSDEKGHFSIFNSEMEQITGYTKEEANAAENFYELIHPHMANQHETAIEDLTQLQVGEKRSGEVVIHTKSGIKKNVVVSTTVLLHNDKKMFLSAFNDITERKRAENELRGRNVELEKITAQLNEAMVEVQNARANLEDKVRAKTEELRQTLIQVEDLARFSSEDPFPVLRVSPGGQLRYANAASNALLEAWKTRIGGMLPQAWSQIVSDVFESNNRKIAEVELEKGIISFVMVPVRSGGYVNMYGRDVTREKEVERMKNEFISMVSHQVRTPLTSMRWYSEMLMKAKDSLSPDQLEIAGTIHETAIQLAELVNDLLNISRMESGRLEFKPEKGDLKRVVEGIVKELAMQADKHRILIEVEAQDFPEFVFDPKLVREVIMNLISNAIKYSREAGKVMVKVNKVENNMVQVQVSDSGIGIPKEAQEGIFNRFYRAQNAVDADIEGTGLGLSVAKMMVEKCGGKIWFESEEGKGTSFYFTLPLSMTVEVETEEGESLVS